MFACLACLLLLVSMDSFKGSLSFLLYRFRLSHLSDTETWSFQCCHFSIWKMEMNWMWCYAACYNCISQMIKLIREECGLKDWFSSVRGRNNSWGLQSMILKSPFQLRVLYKHSLRSVSGLMWKSKAVEAFCGDSFAFSIELQFSYMCWNV